MPITVLHRAQGSEEALARAASDVGARSFWDRFLKSGLAGAQIVERRRGQERAIEAQREAQLRAADIRVAERKEVRGFAGEREAGLARSATSETGVEPLPGETSAGFLQRVQPDIGLAREAKVANAREVRRIEEIEAQRDAVNNDKTLTPDQRDFELQRLAREEAKLPPRGKPPAPAEMFEKTTYTDPSTGAVIGFDPQTGKPFKLLDRPKPGEGADAPISREDFGKRFQVTLKRLQERAQLTKGQAATVKAVTAEDVVEEMRKEDEAFGRYQGVFEQEVPGFGGADPQPGAEVLPAPEAAPSLAAESPEGLALAQSPDFGAFWRDRPAHVTTPEQFKDWVRQEKPRVLAKMNEPAWARVAAKLRKLRFEGRAMRKDEVERRVIAQILAEENVVAAQNDPEQFQAVRAAYIERFGR